MASVEDEVSVLIEHGFESAHEIAERVARAKWGPVYRDAYRAAMRQRAPKVADLAPAVLSASMICSSLHARFGQGMLLGGEMVWVNDRGWSIAEVRERLLRGTAFRTS